MSGFKLPLFMIFGRRPVKFVSTPDGGMDILAFDWITGEFKRDMSYLSKYFRSSPECEEISKEEFELYVKRLICEIREKNNVR